MSDNQLSGKLETAIQSLDNLTKVYHAFTNAKPVPGSPAVTPGHRYDDALVPLTALESQRPEMRRHYAGISENIAGLIENILALKAAVKDVISTFKAAVKDVFSALKAAVKDVFLPFKAAVKDVSSRTCPRPSRRPSKTWYRPSRRPSRTCSCPLRRHTRTAARWSCRDEPTCDV